MRNKLIVLSILVTGFFSSVAMAGGNHTGEHKHQTKATRTNHEHTSKEHRHVKATKHGDEHHHDNEASSVGKPALAAKATKTIRLTTEDTMRFIFASTPDLKNGDIVKFVITNKGQIAHEFSIGDETEQQAHREMMRKMPGMVHQDGNTVTIQPGETRELAWQFKSGNDVVFACNIPGHFEAGMVARAKIASSHQHH